MSACLLLVACYPYYDNVLLAEIDCQLGVEEAE